MKRAKVRQPMAFCNVGVKPGGAIARLLCLLALSPLLCSCFLWTTRDEGDALREKTVRLERRIDELDGELAKERRELTEMIERAGEDVEKLESMISRATRVLARNSADFGAEMESAKDKMREMEGALAELRHELEQIGSRLEESNRRVREFALAAGLDVPVDESRVPGDEKKHFQYIEESLAADRYGETRSLSKVFLERYPNSDRADDVQLRIAKSYIAQERWAKALGALRRFTDRYPKSELTPEVLYEMAGAFYALGDCTDARILVDAITSRHSKSPFAERARKLLDEMQRNKSLCTS
ncbi:MAG: outer membrane protein assembly factor BamD [Polyangia bacterium]